MFSFRTLSITATAILAVLVSACSTGTSPEPPVSSETAEVNFEDLEDLDRSQFNNPTDIDNQWLPLQPGMQWIFEGAANEDGESIPHRIVFTVTDLTKLIADIPTTVAWIEDYAGDELVEAEIAFFAQDDSGNVWYFGEYPEEYEDGELVDAPAWIAGLEDAKAGIKMKAEPRLGTTSYSQGWAPAVEWTDRGQVYKMGQQTCVPFDCYADVVVIDEFNKEEPGAIQQKYYARGVGNVRVSWRGEDEQQEELELVNYAKLNPETLEEARTQALALEARAYQNSRDIYGQTAPSEILAQAVSGSRSAGLPFEEFDYNNFDDPTSINNEWLPLKPGTKWIFEGFTVEDGQLFDHLLVFIVTDLVKEIDGVQTVVAWIEDYSNDQLIEAEIAFYAQDNDGNVWYMGEYPEEYENGKFIAAPAWIAGVQDARAGIKMPAFPKSGTPSYSQGLAPVVQWTDRGQVYRMDQQTCVPFDCFQNVLIMDEFNLEEPGAIQLKYYAPGIGQVRVGFRGEEIHPEILELVEWEQLDQESLSEARAAALELEKNAYQISKGVYGSTSPAEIRENPTS